MAQRMKLKKREIALAVGSGILLATAALGVISDGFGGTGSWFKDLPILSPPDPSTNPRR